MSLNRIHITTPEQVSISFKIAGLGSRASANIIDWFILILINVALSLSLIRLSKNYPYPNPVPHPAVSSYVAAIMIFLLFLLLWGYFVFFEFFGSGRTPGKVLVGIKVIQDNGQSVTFLASAIRNLFRIIDFLPVLFLLGILMIFFHPQHKRIGDLAAGTLVIYQRNTKRKIRKKNPLEKEIEQRLDTQQISLELNEWSKKKIGIREWELLKTYILRRASLSSDDREKITMQIAGILFPLLGVDATYKPLEEVENYLFASYLQLKEDWQYEDL